MYDTITISNSKGEHEDFKKGLVVELHNGVIGMYPINLKPEELAFILESLK